MRNRPRLKTVKAKSASCNTSSDPAAAVQQRIFAKLMKELGGSYSSTLGINLASVEPDEVFKWFLASLFLGSRVSEGIAIKTYKEFEKTGNLSLERVLATSWQKLIDILDRGGYIMYNFVIAMRLLETTWTLNKKYEGDLNRLHFFATDESDLEKRLRGLGQGIGPATVNIFLIELRGLWDKAEPPLSGPALLASRKLGLIRTTGAVSALAGLRTMWEANGRDERRFSDLEAALVRLGKNYCGKKRCSLCPVKEECQDMK